MKPLFLLVILLAIWQAAFSQTPTLGTYPATTIATASGNATISPTSAPGGATGITAFTSLNFKGQLFVNQTTGAVNIINAYPAGTYFITVKAFNSTASTTSTFTITVGNSTNCQPLFSVRPTLTTGTNSNPRGIAIGDFNNDSRQDFATANATGTVSIRLGNDTGGFAPLITSAVFSAGLQDLAVADFNEDGRQDLAITNPDSSQIIVLTGNGAGGFTLNRKINLTGGAISIAVADFNNDGHADIACALVTANTIAVRLGDGTGNFNGSFSVGTGPRPCGLSIADFNRDGNPDFVVANFDSNNLSVGLGNGTGGFATPFTLPAAQYPFSTVVDDFNNDGNPDIVAGYTTNTFSVSVYLGNGTGGFTASTADVNSYQTALKSGDFNGDGKQDLAIAYQSGNRLFVATGNGNGGFTINTLDVMNTGSTPQNLITGDFNQDGRQDIAAGNGFSSSITVRWGNEGEIDVLGNGVSIADGDNTPSIADSTDFGTFSPGTRTQRTYIIRNIGPAPLRINSISLAGADSAQFIKSSGLFPVVVSAAGGSYAFTISFNPVSSGLKTTTVKISNTDCDEGDYDYKIQGTGMAVTPILGNYAAATVVAAGGNITVSPSAPPSRTGGITATTSPLFKGSFAVDTATGSIRITNAHPAGIYPVTVTAFNGTISVNRTFTLTVGNTLCSQGLFTPATTQKVGSQPFAGCIGDFNRDGNQDIAVANAGSNSVSIRLGNGSGGFTAVADIAVGIFPLAVVTGDANSDGKPDLLVTNSTSGTNGFTVSVLLGNGSGGFVATTVSIPNRPEMTLTGDFNNDGRLDFATFSRASSLIYPFLGDGVGNFTAAPTVGGFYGLEKIAVGDFNGDGKQDLVAVDSYGLYGAYAIRFGNGMGGFSGTGSATAGMNPYYVTVADLNKDGKADFVTASFNSLVAWLGDGIGNFYRGTDIPVANLLGLTSADVNGDGNTDIIAFGGASAKAIVLAGDGTGMLQIRDSTRLGAFSSNIAIGDVNADGWQDMVAPSRDNDSLYITLGKPNEIDVKGNGISIAAGDLTPSFTDSTDFGKNVITTRPFRRYFIYNTGSVALIVNSIQLSGADATSFRIDGILAPLIIPANSYQSFIITFAATTTGVKTATVRITNNDCDEPVYDFDIQGTARDAGASLHFDGVNDYISVNATTGNVDTAGLTVSAWVKTAATTTQTIISKGNSCAAGSYFVFGINTAGQLYIDLNDATGNRQYLTGRKLVNNNLWHQVVATRSSTRISLYVDGYLDTTIITAAIATVNNTAMLLAGALVCGNTDNFFTGQMDELKLYNRTLSLAELQTHVYCELSGPQNGLLLYYVFNQGLALENNTDILIVADSSRRGNTGQLINFALLGATSNWAAPGAISTGIACTGRSMWLGINRNWNDPVNWSGGFVPGAFTSVIIDGIRPLLPEVNSLNAMCYSLMLLNGATITVKPNGHLTIVGP